LPERAIGGAEDALYIGTTDGRVEAVRPPVGCSGHAIESFLPTIES
jgi:hypothetical protein